MAKWMNEEKDMTSEIVGGNVFEFSTEVANLVNSAALVIKADSGKYGVGYFQPDDCDHDTVPCEYKPYPEYDNLKRAFTTTAPSSVTLDNYNPTRDAILKCPKTMSTDLPKTPNVAILACSALQPVCNSSRANSYPHTEASAAVGEKRTPSNDKASDSASNSKKTATSAATRAQRATLALVAMAIAALVR
ncbi:hypothetical protein PHYBOEH_008131 [Phytophthora boehmeriae]|uniref:Uncharacterized protein n=1 Tax=Phytophthora boehmeriae TaxID=109152 RepID=A0A8T1W2H5_9STRA|nr:hypothetical protein PHYBOEH_008131 [Phytophthora boehmeriae]